LNQGWSSLLGAGPSGLSDGWGLAERDFTLPIRVIIFPEEKYVFNRISETNKFSDLGYPEGDTRPRRRPSGSSPTLQKVEIKGKEVIRKRQGINSAYFITLVEAAYRKAAGWFRPLMRKT
jgi:hypothetical protein